MISSRPEPVLLRGDCLEVMRSLPDACVAEGVDCVGIEQDEQYMSIAERRIQSWPKD